MRASAFFLCVLLLTACGGDDDALDRTNPQAVYERAMQAVHDADWKTLQTLLTKNGRLQLERDLARIKRRLAHPDDGKQERALARQRLGERHDEEIRRVVDGGLADSLRFIVLLMPRQRTPPQRGMELKPRERKMLYVRDDGTVLPVRLVQQHDKWYVEDLQL